MNRTILNFEATISSNGLKMDGQYEYTVRLYVNHHIVAHWGVSTSDGYLMDQNRARLDAFVARKLFQMLHQMAVTNAVPD